MARYKEITCPRCQAVNTGNVAFCSECRQPLMFQDVNSGAKLLWDENAPTDKDRLVAARVIKAI